MQSSTERFGVYRHGPYRSDEDQQVHEHEVAARPCYGDTAGTMTHWDFRNVLAFVTHCPHRVERRGLQEKQVLGA